MFAVIKLTSCSMGSLFAIPESDWTAISKRVGLTVLLEGTADYIAPYIRDFRNLEIVCKTWKDATFPELVTQSHNLSHYSTEAIQSFSELQRTISNLDPNEDLPPGVKQKAETVIGQLARSTGSLNQAFFSLTQNVKAFVSENNMVDAEIHSYVDRLGPDWQWIGASTKAVENAAGLVLGTWQAIASDLDNVVSGQITVTTKFLLNLDIQWALNSWKDLQNETDAFPSMAKGQDEYLTGRWLNRSAKR